MFLETPKVMLKFHLLNDFFCGEFSSMMPGLWGLIIPTWNPKQPFINGCFPWMIANLYIGNGCFTKHQFLNGCLGFQEGI